MNRLDAELQRLFVTDDDTLAQGLVRSVVLGVSAPADWSVLSPVWRGVQEDLGLPAPAIAVNGVDAIELRFSLATPVPMAVAADFLERLCARYMNDVRPARRRLWPAAEPGLFAQPASVPGLQAETGLWAAFVAPDLAAIFGDDPSLDMAPGDDAQAELLMRLRPITRTEFELAFSQLNPEPAPFLPVAQAVTAPAPTQPAVVTVAGRRFDDPREFLREVMNDAGAPLELRIQAAKALLP